jgi:hypothetical protein
MANKVNTAQVERLKTQAEEIALRVRSGEIQTSYEAKLALADFLTDWDDALRHVDRHGELDGHYAFAINGQHQALATKYPELFA